MTQGLRLNSGETALSLFVGLAWFVDIPAARAYNDHSAWTEVLGRYLFHGLKELTGVPIPFTPFEVLSYCLALSLPLIYGAQRARYWLCLGFLALLLPGICLFAAVTGWARGNSFGLALTQLHFIPMLTAWLAIGYYTGTRPLLFGRLLRVLFWVCLWRSVYALYVYFLIYGGSLGAHEYLIDHATSMFLAAAMSYAAIQGWFQRRHPRRLLFYAAATGLILLVYMLNDRRASFAGLAAAVLLLPFILPPRLRAALLRPYKYGLVFGVAALAFLAVKSQDPYSFVGALRTETVGGSSLTYRQIENYNLMIGLIQQPLLGMGFGTRFPQALELPDISFAFELFDAIPHNSVYFLWTFGGPLAIASLMTLSCGLLCVVTRVGRMARHRSQLLVAAIGLVVSCQWLMYVLFDMGLLDSRSLMMIGIFAGGLFPVYARLLGEHYHAQRLTPVPVPPVLAHGVQRPL